MRNRRPKQHKVSMALMGKLIEDLYRPYVEDRTNKGRAKYNRN